MPQYYEQNNVLGPRPAFRAPAAKRPNLALATLIVLLCVGAGAALIYFRPTGGGGLRNLSETVPYVVAEFGDGQRSAGTGWICSPEGHLLTTRAVAFPRGQTDKPTRYRVFLNSGVAGQQEVSATVVSPDETAAAGSPPDWVLLKLSVTEAVPYLVADVDPAAAAASAAVVVAGYRPETGSYQIVAIETQVEDPVSEGQQVVQFSYATTIAGMDGAPVISRADGRVVGMNLAAQGGSGTALPVHRIDGLEDLPGQDG